MMYITKFRQEAGQLVRMEGIWNWGRISLPGFACPSLRTRWISFCIQSALFLLRSTGIAGRLYLWLSSLLRSTGYHIGLAVAILWIELVLFCKTDTSDRVHGQWVVFKKGRFIQQLHDFGPLSVSMKSLYTTLSLRSWVRFSRSVAGTLYKFEFPRGD